ncbi:TonB-dependent receptor [Rhodanobacter sp. B05]|uniref:TonB-dependent receptor family protein n=1 Tax=Rhodanobacter sp. B05 TaxID=1945859 RepID=UPI0011155D8B|nr:TonB-dependent receptor [Rhodanobacter sp. B05]
MNSEAWRETLKAKLEHMLPEVDGTKITVTRKTTVTHLADQPTVIGNNLDQLLARSPGVQVSQQPTPTQFNLSYRGLGNPQESEYVLVMQDGIPLESDWIGFPTLYAMPLTQSLSEVELIRGGSSLLYGPEPAPVINLVSRRPKPGAPFSASSEQVVGNHGLYSTYDAVEGSSGRWTYRADAAYVRSDGSRPNAGSQMRQADLYLDYRPDDRQLWWIDLHAINAASGDAGRLGYPQWQANPRATPTPYNRDWVTRDQLVLGHRRTFGDGWLFEGKLWFAYQDLASRGANGALAPQPPPTGTTLQDEQFRTAGADLRLRKKWGRGNAFTIGTTLFHGDDPFRQWSSSDLYVDRHDRSGTPRLVQARTSDYAAIFAENVFRLPHRFHIVPSVRLEHERVAVDESVRPPFLSRPLIHEADARSLPLFGLGVGNDFGHGNETYFSVSQGWRPLRYFDMASPFANVVPGHAPDPSKSLSYELGVHGVPVTGLYYDVSVFWIDFRNRIEAQHINATDVIEVNSGDTRSRGFEGQLNYDFLANTALADRGEHLEAFVSASLLNARFTASVIPGQVGKIPAYAPRYLLKAGVNWRVERRIKLSLTAVSSAAQFWQDSDQPLGSGNSYLPARIPAYTVLDLAGDWQLNRHVTLLAGVSNLADRQYYDRVWQTGLEPALGRSWYAGVRLGL